VFLWMLPSVLQRTLHVDSPVHDKVALAPPPMGPLGSAPHSFLGGWHYAVPRTANAPSAACDFIAYMVSSETQKERALRGGPLPTLKAIYNDEDVLAFNPHYREVKQILLTARCRADIPRYAEVTRLLQRHLHSVLQGRAEPASALAAAAGEVSRLLQ
jgi:ABC-type glycerol-3-phosphate transport system substrate-binding protein